MSDQSPEPELGDPAADLDAAASDGAPIEEVADEQPPTFWDGQPAPARRVSIVVADDPRYPAYWASGLVGQRRDAVEVSHDGETFYLDDERYQDAPAMGWEKVTVGRGASSYGHRALAAEPGSVRERGGVEAEAEPADDATAAAAGGVEESDEA